MAMGIFVDTAGWGSIIDPGQEFHISAATLYRDARTRAVNLVTTSYVIAELVSLLTSPFRIPRPRAVAFIEGLKRSPYVEIVFIDQARDEQAWGLLTQRQDKNWSLVDCASFLVMQELDLNDALTSDHHFEQAGYQVLLK